MTKLPAVTYADVDRALRRMGFVISRQRGSHVSYRHPDGRATTVPKHGSRDIATPLVREILREAEIGADDFVDALRRA